MKSPVDHFAAAVGIIASGLLSTTTCRAERLEALPLGGLVKRAHTTVTYPAAVEIAASQYWDGNDGPWSSFPVQLGQNSQTQNVRVLLSTIATFTWVVAPDGCPDGYVANCADSRGGLYYANKSSTWQATSLYDFKLEENLDLNTNGNFGYEDLTLGWQGSGSTANASVEHAVVATIQDSRYWLGQFGLNPRPTNFTVYSSPQPSVVDLLYEQGHIPSHSYGYTAGNQYRLNQVYGSLVLGGYDQNRFTQTKVTFPFYADISRDLLVNVQSITSDSGTDLLPDGSVPMLIDSTVSMIYLPNSSCLAFEKAFNLTYDESYSPGLYLMTSAQRAALQASNPSVTFTLGPNAKGGETVNITLPYGAFDLQVNYPIVADPNTSYYFPLQRATNSTQYTLGRTFLQEAYLIADYDRSNFTVAPCKWDSNTTNPLIRSIYSPNITAEMRANSKSGSGGISGGAIAGVVIGIVAAITLLGAVLWFFRRRRQVEKRRAAELEAKEAGGAGKDAGDANSEKPFISQPMGGELGGGDIHEMSAPQKQHAQELDSPYRLDPNKAGYSEMGGSESLGPGKGYAHEMQGDGSEIYEMPGSDVHEMAGTTFTDNGQYPQQKFLDPACIATHITTDLTPPHESSFPSNMSGIMRALGVVGALGLTGSAAMYATRDKSDFSKSALAAAEHGAEELTEAVRPKLPKNFIQISVGDFKWSNARQ
ncbi:putative peptidase A1 family protein [Teratosphaeria destructans]|uniref:Peptidase A1 family protein n=1 Tax=Teratosphaeria destructans TaxID=418781 RepID=A0A9W7SYA7_9PEZI|nr:putative peptidase A1 family protein [Teratosphaeria destructans]